MDLILYFKKLWFKNWHGWFNCICFFTMFIGMFYARALLSIGMMGFIANAFLTSDVNTIKSTYLKNKFVLFSLLYFLSCTISFFWSDSQSAWLSKTILKVPFALLPAAILLSDIHKKKYFYTILTVITTLLFGIVVYGILQLVLHYNAYVDGYNFSKLLPTTGYSDHIRFSLCLLLNIALLVYVLDSDKQISKRAKKAITFLIILFSLYIHILAAKTGLIGFYLFAIPYVLFRARTAKKKWVLYILALIIFMLPVVSYRLIPTFNKKINYVKHEISLLLAGQKPEYQYSDAGRIITYDLAFKYIKHHFILGSGIGDTDIETYKLYDIYYPEVPNSSRFAPINQLLHTLFSVGIILCCIGFIPMVLSTFTSTKTYGAIYINTSTIILLFAMMVESMFEVQFGVFVYILFISLWVKLLKH